MKRLLYFAYGLACYAGFLAIYTYLCGFTGNLLVPKSIDAPAKEVPAYQAVAIDLLLLLGFGLQHSVMARPAFKRVWTRLVPHPIERSTYMLASCIALGVVVWLWQPLNAIVWSIRNPVGTTVLWTLFAAGWLGVPIVSLMIGHFDLFGLRQVWLHLRGHDIKSLPFRTPYAYSHVRHPLYVAWAVAFWATPTMTVGHLLYAVVLTGYMALAARVEERDLVAHFGQQYQEYQRNVPRYVPSLRRTTESASIKGIPTVADSVA